jgi:plasmid maintenance system killer protein
LATGDINKIYSIAIAKDFVVILKLEARSEMNWLKQIE